VTSWDVDDWLDSYEAKTAEARIVNRYDLIDEHARLDIKLATVPEGERRQLAEKIVALEAEIDAAEKVFTFQDIGGQWLALIGEHPPTKDQLEVDKQLDHNPETFPVAAVSASSLAPKLSVRQVERLREKLRMPDWQKLWAATLEANLGVVGAPKSMMAGVVLRQNGVSATTPVRKGSRGRSSSAASRGKANPTG
jgi:hypothetical protein